MDSKLRVAFMGAGKVGTTLACALNELGYPVPSVYSRSPESAAYLAAKVGAAAVPTPTELVANCDLIFLTVPDDKIADAAHMLRDQDLGGKSVIHTSGVYDLEILAPLNANGAMTGCLHPAFPFTHKYVALERLAGTAFAIESSHPLLSQWLIEMVDALRGQHMLIPSGGKAVYHAALSIASNYTVTLYATAQKLLLDLGMSQAAADAALDRLMQGTVDNLLEQGVPDALTGAVLRGDVQTISAHMQALAQDSDILDAYMALGRLTVPLARQRGLGDESIRAMTSLFAEHKDDHHA